MKSYPLGLPNAGEQSASLEDPPHLRALRKSCDRCHTQKLKCTPGNDANSQCMRCQQAGCKCVYSPRLPKRSHQRGQITTGLDFKTTAAAPIQQNELKTLTQAYDAGSDGIDSNWVWSCSKTCNSPDNTSAGSEYFDNPSMGMLSASGPNMGIYTSEPDDILAMQIADSALRNGDTNSCAVAPLASCGQFELCHNLSCMSQELETIFHSVTTEWPQRNIQTYPIGEVLDVLRKLAVSLQQPFQSTTHLDECLRTKNTFLALYSYVTGIKIMESLAKILQQQVQGAKQPNLASRHNLTTVNISKETDRGDKYAQSDVNISELFSHMQPYLHALTTSCTALYLCLQLLQEVGGALDIRQEQRVDISLYLPANKHKVKPEPKVMASGTLSAGHLMTVLWNGGGDERDCASALRMSLDNLRTYCIELFSLAIEHNISFSY